MAQFMLAFHGGGFPETEQERANEMAAWGSWMQGLGAALIVPGSPVGMSKTVTNKGVEDNGGSNPLSGYSVVEAGDMDAAIKMAQGCPILKNGSVEVAPLIAM